MENRLNKIPWRRFFVLILPIIMLSIPNSNRPSRTISLDAPLPIYPENNSTTTTLTDPPLGIPSFSWSPISGALLYHLQVDDEIGFDHPVLDVLTANASFTPHSSEQLITDGEWYWRVRVESPNPHGDWSPLMHFTKSWATSQNRPTLLAPENEALLAFFEYPAFSWLPVTGAAYYLFQISSTPDGFVTPLLSVDTLLTAYQPPTRLANGVYYWQVIPLDASGHSGTPSQIRQFRLVYGSSITNMVPLLISPADDSYPLFTPTFQWTAIEGVEFYQLEYTSNEGCNFNLGVSIKTSQTYFTPSVMLSNGIRYCWRVRAESGPAIGDWSDTWHFQRTWNLQASLLTPTQRYQTNLYPLYSWTPVPGASRYLVQIANNPEFNPIFEEATTANTTYTPQEGYDLTAHFWWRVKPIDGGGNNGVFSAPFEFQNIYTSTAPSLIYPLYYYPADNVLNPNEDRTVAIPVFIWHRVMIPGPMGGIYANAYRIQVNDTPNFSSPDWQYDTENTSATPTLEDNFVPISGQDYFWRVCPLEEIGGDCLANIHNQLEWWSQIWRVRFDDDLALAPTHGIAPALLRPAHGLESVETTPMLEWWPLQEATLYQVEISREADFSSHELSDTMAIPVYSPRYSLAQRNLDRTDYGTFYWRVRGFVGDAWSSWSNSWRFQIASQSEWQYSRSPGGSTNRLIIGDDPEGDASPIYDLSDLNVSQSNTHWFLGFHANSAPANVTYGIYIDLDHIDGSGASLPPGRDYDVSAILAHQPEYALFVDALGGAITSQNTWVYIWKGDTWDFGKSLSELGGSVFNSSGYIELQIPNNAIGMEQETSSMCLELFSVDATSGLLQDSVPSDPAVPGNGELSHFSAVSERMNLIYPPSMAAGEPWTMPSVLPFFWDWPSGKNGATPFAGSVIQVDLDQAFSAPLEIDLKISSKSSYLSENHVALVNDIVGDNRYYWRIQPRYWKPGFSEVLGAWSEGWSFAREGFTVQNLRTSTSSATPSFSWDMAEGADIYRLQVSSGTSFSTNVIDVITPINSFTPPVSLPQGVYYWRVKIIRNEDIENDWSTAQQFILSTAHPTGLTPDGEAVLYAPTFCWDPLIGYEMGLPFFTAWRYRVQLSQDPDFNAILESIDTINNCWTPIKEYGDQVYYWRVTAIDGNNNLGTNSNTATFTKQYPTPSLESPIGEVVHQTPTFFWDSVHGAAAYKLELSWFPTFSPLYEAVISINTQYTPTTIMAPGHTYYWRVAMRDNHGNQGPFASGSFLFAGDTHNYLPLIGR